MISVEDKQDEFSEAVILVGHVISITLVTDCYVDNKSDFISKTNVAYTIKRKYPGSNSDKTMYSVLERHVDRNRSKLKERSVVH